MAHRKTQYTLTPDNQLPSLDRLVRATVTLPSVIDWAEFDRLAQEFVAGLTQDQIDGFYQEYVIEFKRHFGGAVDFERWAQNLVSQVATRIRLDAVYYINTRKDN